ncbi:metallophosphoesterase [Gracilibacillus suaedae]|uniref:metallophosphoesterase n=1 Tax=Gracilibacillus suaedae TaxID=2820273 RepID=UPI001ABEBC55|nr:metallophosphoesterase [Gracilibacillus suaedae]
MFLFLFISFIILVCLVIFKAYKNTQNIVVRKVKIDNNETESVSTLNILHLSDLHLENISISAELLYEKLKNEAIDLIALTGDFLDRKRTIPKLIPYLKVFNKLNPKYGIYTVLGNHDYVLKGVHLQSLIDTLNEYNCQVMQNSSETIYIENQPVNIIGIDDYSTNRSDLLSSYHSIKKGTNLVLTHDPNVVLDMKKYHFDYLLAGHFHGGQICYPKAYHLAKMGKLAKMNVIKGLHSHDGRPFYISEGLGQTGVNIRVGSLPEITLHQLSIAKDNTDLYSAI